MVSDILLKDGFDEAANLLGGILDFAIASLESPVEGKVFFPTLEALMTPMLKCSAEERKAVMKAAGLTSAPHPVFLGVSGLSMGLAREKIERKKSARANAIPQEALWAIAGAGVAGTQGQRLRALRVLGWVQSQFLLSGARIVSDLADLHTLWTIIAIVARSQKLAAHPGIAALESMATLMAAKHPIPQLVDQLICCEIARALMVGSGLPEEHPLMAYPLIAAPRYALKYNSKNGRAKGEPRATFRKVPTDLEPYVFFRKKA